MKTMFNKPEKIHLHCNKTFAILLFVSVLLIPGTASSNTSSTTYWDVTAILDFGGTFPVTADMTLITSGSTFTMILTTKEIAGWEEEHTIIFEGTHENGVYTISNYPFSPFENSQATLKNAVFTVNGDNLTGEGSFSETIEGIGEIEGTVTATGTKVGEDPFLTVTPVSLTLAAASGSQASFDISSNIDWNVTKMASWISVSSHSGSNNGAITVTAAANSFPSERSAIILVYGSGVVTQDINVTQAANNELTFGYPVPRYGHTASKLCKYVYLFGGRNYQSTLKSAALDNDHENYLSTALYRYDTITHEINKLNPDLEAGSDPLPGMMGHNSIAYDNKMFILNGTRSDTTNNQLYIYDPITYTWEQNDTPIPYSQKSHCFSSLENPLSVSLVVFGGQKSNKLASDSCHRFTYMSAFWSSLPSMPIPTYSGAYNITQDKFYIVGGMTDEGPTNQILAYNQIDRSWTSMENTLPAAMYGMSFASIGNKLYLYGGAGLTGLKSVNRKLSQLFSTTLYQVTIDTINNEIDIAERAAGLPPLLYSSGWTEENDGDTLFYTFGGINAIFPDGDTLLTNNFYRFNLTDSLVQQYDTLTQTWGNLKPEIFTSDDTLNFDADNFITETIYIASNATWDITSDQTWLNIDIETSPGNQAVTVSAEENTSLSNRSANLQITCNGVIMDNIIVEQYGAEPYLSVSETSINVTAEAQGTSSFSIISNTNWLVESSQTWLSADLLSGTGNGTISLTVEENTSLDERFAVITISSGDAESHTVTLTQAGATPYLTLSTTGLNVEASASSAEIFDIYSNISWNLSADQTWLMTDSESGTGNATISVDIEVNTTVYERVATITITSEEITAQTITVTQAAGSATLSVSVSALDIGAEEGSEATFDVTSNTTWTLSSDQRWLTYNPESGSGDGTISLTAQANTTGSTRQAYVTVSAEGAVSQTVEVSQISLAGINEYPNGTAVYPNPFTNGIYVNCEKGKVTVSVYSLNGQLMLLREISSKEIINTSALSEGVYFVEVSGQDETFRIKMIKQKE